MGFKVGIICFHRGFAKVQAEGAERERGEHEPAAQAKVTDALAGAAGSHPAASALPWAVLL